MAHRRRDRGEVRARGQGGHRLLREDEAGGDQVALEGRGVPHEVVPYVLHVLQHQRPVAGIRDQRCADRGHDERGGVLRAGGYQHNNMQVYDQALNNSYGSIYQGTREITFHIDFKNTDYIGICGRFQWGTGASWGTVYESSSKSSMRIRGFDYFSRASGTKVNIDWFAIGKWK